VIAAGVLALDQLSKALIASSLAMHETRPVISGFVNLTRVHNTGAAFGIFAGQASSFRTLVFLSVSILAVVVIFWMLVRLAPTQRVEMVALALILGGALGNMLDRVRLGEVVDFIDVYYGSYHWPAFNVADSAISIGVTLLLWCLVVRAEV
jgi:signal peptidase II